MKLQTIFGVVIAVLCCVVLVRVHCMLTQFDGPVFAGNIHIPGSVSVKAMCSIRSVRVFYTDINHIEQTRTISLNNSMMLVDVLHELRETYGSFPISFDSACNSGLY